MGRKLGARAWIPVLVILCCRFPLTALASEYDFAIPEAEPRSFTVGGRLTARYIYHRLDDTTAGYQRLYAEEDPGSDTHDRQATAELSAAWRKSPLQARLLTHHQYTRTHYSQNEWSHDFYEAYVSLAPSPGLILDAGKKSVLWGTGYAWNPAGFLNRPKDTDDPALNLEGRSLAGVDLIKSFSDHSVKNMGLTALVLPVIKDLFNTDMGEDGDVNIAVKWYLLWYDTDIDVIYFNGQNQPESLGFDFAKNLTTNFAVHGEMAFQKNAPRQNFAFDGTTWQTTQNQFSYLLGIRYLNAHDATFILEYYHNGAGYAPAAPQLFQQRNTGKEYAYLKVSQKEPLDYLYVTAWMAAMVNLHDHSFNLQTGLTWTPVTNLEINCRVGVPRGGAQTEFGEKPDRFRPEIWVRFYF